MPFGRVIAESLVCGTPVVSFDVGACGEVAGPGAILVNPGDTHALASEIMHLIEHPDQKKKLVEEGRRHVEQLYEASMVVEKFSQLLSEEALNRKRTSPPARLPEMTRSRHRGRGGGHSYGESGGTDSP